MKKHIIFGSMLAVMVGLFSCDKDDNNPELPSVIKGSGNIGEKVNEFRQLLGNKLNTTPEVTGGRREINWDGVPDSLMGKAMPLDFFNPVGPGAPPALQRGLTYAAAGQFRVSNNNFTDVNANAAGQLQPFSGNKTFANISSNAWEIVVEKPGKRLAARTQGFGMVFSDVDLPNSTSLEFFNGTKSLGRFYAPVHDSTGSFSFLGVYFKGSERISRILVQHDGILADGLRDISDNGTTDLVLFDDILYAEPVAAQ